MPERDINAEAKKELGVLIKRWRDFAGLSQEALAERLRTRGLGTSRTTIVAWEKGENAPAGQTLMVLSQVLREAAENRRRPPDLVDLG